MTTHVRRIFAVASVALVVVAAAWYFLLWSPESKKLTQAHAARAAAEGQVSQLTTQEAQLASLLKNLPSDTARLKALEAALPNNPALDSALNALHQTATATGATVLSVGPSTPAGSASANGGSSSASATPGGPSVTLQITATGSLPQLENFLSRLTNLAETERVFVVDHISISGASVVQASFTARVFYAGQPTP